MKNRSFPKRIRCALAGLGDGWRRERSFRAHSVCAVLALVALLILQPPPIWWAVVAVISAAVMAMELFNSALEALIDHLHPDLHPEIRRVKDMAAGGVLLLSIAALLVGVALLLGTIFKANGGM